MIVETRGRAWVSLVTRRFSPALVVIVSYTVMALPALLFTDRPAYTPMLEALGAFSLISLVVSCDKAAPFRVLDHPLLRWNGRLSYSFYLWHYFILTMAVRGLYLAFSPALLHENEVVVCALTAAVTVAAALAVAQLSYSWIELPFIDLGRRLASAWRTRHGRARAGRLSELTQEQAAP
jgi:peptidoglycan/LPS O-acetylase OafA/YrhL